MLQRKDYPIISVFVDYVNHISKEQSTFEEELTADTTLYVSAYSKISQQTREKSLDFAHEQIKYFTPNLLLHHYQDDVPVFTIYSSGTGIFTAIRHKAKPL